MSDIDVLKKENDSLVTKLDVITAVLTAKPIDGKPAMHLQEFKKLVEDDFVKKFAAKEETLSEGCCHICKKGSEHSIINTDDKDLVLLTVVVER